MIVKKYQGNNKIVRSSQMLVESCSIDNGCSNGSEKRNDSLDTTRTLSSYEQQRALKIERNNSRLRSLGLISKEEEEHSNAVAWGATTTESHPKSKTSQIQNPDTSSLGLKQNVLKVESDGNSGKKQLEHSQGRRKSLRVRKKNQRTNGGVWI